MKIQRYARSKYETFQELLENYHLEIFKVVNHESKIKFPKSIWRIQYGSHNAKCTRP